MSVESMELATIGGSFENLDKTLDVCRTCGCFQPENMSFSGGASRLSENNPYRPMLERLNSLLKSTGIEPSPTDCDDIPLSPEEVREKIDNVESDLGKFRDEISAIEKEQDYCNVAIQLLEHFPKLDIPLSELIDCKFVSIRLGRLPVSGYKLLSAYADNPDVLFYTFSSDKDYYWGMYIVSNEYVQEVDRIFAGLSFEQFRIPESFSAPAEAITNLKDQLESDRERLDKINSELSEYLKDQYDSINKLYSKLSMLNSRFELRKYVSKQGEHFVMMGWFPTSQKDRLIKALNSIDTVSVSITKNKSDDRLSPPVKLKNNFFTRPFEFYIKMFGVPKYGEIDPTAFVAITYTLLYGIMFADLGQGLILSIVGFLMYKLKGMELGKLIIPCGIFGSFFGLIFGSVFGFEHALDGFYRKLGFSEKPIEVMSSENIIYVLFSAVGIGAVLMLIALLLNIYSKFKQGNPGAAIFGENGIVGFVFYSGVLLIIGNILLKLGIPTLPLILIGCVLPIACIWLKEPLEKLVNGEKDWQPESWGGYLVQGFFEVFESVLSYVTNTVSFLRVGAFVLVHAGMMSVFFTLADMAGGTSGIAGCIIVIFGNIFVIVLEGLLVGVQSLRLEFYEMFNRFFEGSGHEFSPIKY